jgi:hypothetical protein
MGLVQFKSDVRHKMFKLIVAGSRDFYDYEFLKRALDYLLQNIPKDQIQIVSGKARGADALGERYAKERGYPIKDFPADWERWGRRAGPKRNEQMAQYVATDGYGGCVIFRVNMSSGSTSMEEFAKQYKVRVKVYDFKKKISPNVGIGRHQ